MKTLEILSEPEIDRIHSTALDILRNVGVKIASDEARKMLREAGAEVDDKTTLVNFPENLVESSIKLVPQTVIYGARTEDQDITLEPDSEVHSRPITGAEGFIDLNTREYRQATTQDSINWIRLGDALDNISYCTGLYPLDVKPEIRDIHVARLLLENTEKHIELQPYSVKNLEYIIKLALTVQSKEELKKRPLISVLTSATSPLQYAEYAYDIVSLSGEYGVPVEINSMAIGGATAPVTLAGEIALIHAELLMIATIAQLTNPGSPLIYRPLPMILDMQSGNALEGCAENAIMSAALVQLAKKRCNNMPTNMFGQVTDALLPDSQSMIERSFNTILPALAGANIVSGAGHVEHCYTGDLIQLVTDDDLIGMELRALKGIEINGDTLGLGAIKRIGPGGNFLADQHTLKYFRDEYFVPKTFNRFARDTWRSEGGKDSSKSANERARNLLEKHEVPKLASDVVNEISSIVEDAKTYDWSKVPAASW